MATTAFDSPLLTDLYQLTMAQAAWQSGKDALEGSFYAHFRHNPFKGGYALACGTASIAQYVDEFAFDPAELAYLASLPSTGEAPLFDLAFIEHLAGWQLKVDIDCVPEGTVVFAQEPVLRVTGPLSQCLLLETPLLNLLGFQTLVATKAARITGVTTGLVAEFGLRRAQGPAGGVLASRAAYVGGCASTSNVLAGQQHGIPVSGTHSHAWVMAFTSELEAFRAFVASFPHNAVLLVDTYDVLQGVRNAIVVAHEMEARGQRLGGIRIDSGDLAWLSVRARELLDAAGLPEVHIVASNDLDEYTIQSLEAEQQARIDSWGVGTRLAVAEGQPSLGMVYKLSAVRSSASSGAVGDARSVPGGAVGAWSTVLKASEQTSKSTLPGILASRRYYDSSGTAVGDMVHDLLMSPARHCIVDPADPLRQKDLSGCTSRELLEPLVQAGRALNPQPSASQARAYAQAELATIAASNKRLLNPHSYPVGLEPQLLANRDALLKQVRARA